MQCIVTLGPHWQDALARNQPSKGCSHFVAFRFWCGANVSVSDRLVLHAWCFRSFLMKKKIISLAVEEKVPDFFIWLNGEERVSRPLSHAVEILPLFFVWPCSHSVGVLDSLFVSIRISSTAEALGRLTRTSFGISETDALQEGIVMQICVLDKCLYQEKSSSKHEGLFASYEQKSLTLYRHRSL